MKRTVTLFVCTILGLITLATLGACSKSPEPVSFATLEDARNQARANGEYNAQLYRAENPRFTDHKIVSHGDSTQSPDCPQGDGWATNSILSVKGKEVEKFTVKCSTVSQALGCYLESDFVKKPFAAEEGKCQPLNKVPFPLPKLGK
jgi:hypothetical protein